MPLTLVIILFIFVGALIWLVNWEPDKDNGGKKKKDDKTLREEIEGVFKDLKTSALTYKRDECIPSLDTAYSKVIEVLEKRELVKS